MKPTIEQSAVDSAITFADDIAARILALENFEREKMPDWVLEAMAPFADLQPEAMFIFVRRLISHFQGKSQPETARVKLNVFNWWIARNVPAFADHIGRWHAHKDAVPMDARSEYINALGALAGTPA